MSVDMSVNLSTVVTSLVTAGLTTLGAEYAAKPRLEARKERILEAHRARLAASRCIRLAQLKFAQLESTMPGGGVHSHPGYPTPLQDWARDMVAEIHAASLTLIEHTVDLPGSGDIVRARVLSATSGTLMGKTMPGTPLAKVVLSEADDQLLGHALRLLRRGRFTPFGFVHRVQALLWLRAHPEIDQDTGVDEPAVASSRG